MKRTRTLGKKHAFTLIELLVVVAIIGVLMAIILPVYQSVQQTSRKVTCASNLRSILVANQLYLSEHGNVFPNRGDSTLNYGEVAEILLPYAGRVFAIFVCPANNGKEVLPTMTFPSYHAHICQYEFNSLLGNEESVTNRSMTGVTAASKAAYVYDRPYWSNDVNRPHYGGANVGFLDGHVGFLNDAEMNLDGPNATIFYNLGHVY